MSETTKFQILNYWTDNVQFECELSAEIDGRSFGIRLGTAVKIAAEAGANLCGANLCDANLSGANLSGANLSGANFRSANFRSANLSGAYLRRANLCGANLSGANLSGANFRSANLSGANLRSANLSGADLSDADLSDANLSGADLSGADLSGADLSDANLCGADLCGAKWSSTIMIQRALLQISGLDYPVTILDEHMQIGCELHSLAEWGAFDNEAIARMDGLRARRFWARHKDALLALAASDKRGALDDRCDAEIDAQEQEMLR